MQQSTDASPISTDAPQAPPIAAQSPFGPVRKNQPKPPVTIPGQRKPSSSIGPRPALPQSRFAPGPERVATWRQHAEQFFSGDAWDQRPAANAFGGAA